MRKHWQISLLIIAGLFVLVLIMNLFRGDRYKYPDMPKPSVEETTDLSSKAITISDDFNPKPNANRDGYTNYGDKEIIVGEDFKSNLPLVIIDTKGQEPERGVMWDNEKGYHVITDEDPYAYGDITVIDGKNGVNSPKDSPTVTSLCKLKIRGNSSGTYDKKQYLLKLIDDKGKSNKENILGMGSESEWILNVSFIDKSLIRNFLAYTTASQIMPYTPDAKYCEVLFKDENGYKYEGVYMMIEKIGVSKNRVDLPSYSENTSITPALLRRDRYNINDIMLENYGTVNGLTYGYIGIEYPDKDIISDKGIENIQNQIDRFEKALYSEDWSEFEKYRQYIDMDSFVDYFIINEFFLNYDAGYNSTYMYMDYSGKITMGPVWDFDQGIDNDPRNSANLNTTAFQSAPWFDKMLKDPIFTKKIIERYEALRKSILSDESIEKFVNDVVEYLGPAIDRDWARWGYYYVYGNYLSTGLDSTENRNTRTYKEEIDRILNVLSKHGDWLYNRMDSLYQFKAMSLEDTESLINDTRGNYGSHLAVVFVAVFVISIKLVLRYESE